MTLTVLKPDSLKIIYVKVDITDQISLNFFLDNINERLATIFTIAFLYVFIYSVKRPITPIL